MAAGALLLDGGGRVLLVKPTYKDGWDLPGGMVEPGESPAQACAREVREELGLDRPPGRLLVCDWAPHQREGDKVLWVFDGGVLPPSLPGVELDGREIAAARWVRLPDLGEYTPERLSRRVLLAARAVRTGGTLYAEHGVEILPTAAARLRPAEHGTPHLRTG
jgi:8-oxo-dGTP pyrophosphatase MutT (NUDIX family)